MRMIMISDEDYEFLKDLQHELNTQETDCQADPIYWSVMEKREVLTRNFDGEPRVPFDDGAYTLEELLDLAKENIEDYDQEIKDEWKEVDKEDISEVAHFVCERMEFDNIYCDDIYYVTEEDHISQFSGAFLTKRACKQHIEGNKHHYDRPRTYANTAYRNYELERLLKILKTMDLKEHNSKPSHVEESSVYDGPEGVWDDR